MQCNTVKIYVRTFTDKIRKIGQRCTLQYPTNSLSLQILKNCTLNNSLVEIVSRNSAEKGVDRKGDPCA